MRRKLGFVSVGTMLLATLAVAQTPARAGVAPAGSPGTSATVAEARATINGRVSTDADTAASAGNAYWTPERMRAARPAPMPDGVDTFDGEATDRPGRIGAERDVATPAAPRSSAAGVSAAPEGASQGTQAVNASPGVGRVFFTHKNEDFFCSGGTINNPQANLVSTAGHCVHPGDGGSVWYDNWAYAPEYTEGEELHGLWFAKEFTSVEGWVDWGYLWWDFAFVTMHPQGGNRLVHVTGGQGLSVNKSKSLSALLLGYPGEAPYDGLSQYYAQGTIKAAGAQRVKLKNCPLNHGASGGPFLRAWDNDLRFGYVNSVMSYKYSGNMYGPYFDDDVLDIYNVAKNKQ
ncbi:hypothetical protein [Micromonospora sp. NPDC023888]|uniref:trypsin-like serine peptidase n=1 Tax=Micromonospora sp. NPDC023888 TaxID=3155607 RepID=UPI0033E9C19F